MFIWYQTKILLTLSFVLIHKAEYFDNFRKRYHDPKIVKTKNMLDDF